MSEPTPVELLQAEYAQLLLRQPATLTGDQKRSLVYYKADVSPQGVESAEVTAWLRNVTALEVFVQREGRMPRENRRLPPGAISVEEKKLGYRVRAQRRAFAAGRLCSYQERRLLYVPGFTYHPLEDLWWAHFEAYRLYTVVHQDAPKLRSQNKLEVGLAGWAAKTRMAYRAGTLEQWKRDALDGLDFWSWGAQGGDRYRG